MRLFILLDCAAGKKKLGGPETGVVMNVAKREVSSGSPTTAEEGVPLTIGVDDTDADADPEGDELPLVRTISAGVRAEMLGPEGSGLSDEQKSRLERLDAERRTTRGEDAEEREAWLHATSSREAFAKAQAQRDALLAL